LSVLSHPFNGIKPCLEYSASKEISGEYHGHAVNKERVKYDIKLRYSESISVFKLFEIRICKTLIGL
jgi:hypothetical protein